MDAEIFAQFWPYHDDMDSSAWDERYEVSELVWSGKPNLFLPPLVEGVPPGTALDVACGEGRNSIWLAEHGWDVTAYDFSAVAIDKARSLARDTSVEWIIADVTTYDSTKRFDLVVIFYLHLPQEELASAFERAIDAMVPGGTLFAVGHALSNLDRGYGGPPYPEILWTADRIGGMVSSLNIIDLEERERYIEDEDETAIDLVLWATKSQ